MMRRIAILAVLALGLMAGARTGSVCRFTSAAREFHHHFQYLKAGNSLGLVERFVVSVVLSTEPRS